MKDLFLCHTGADKPFVRALAERLERELVGRRSISVFLDEWDIDYGENLLRRIEEGLKRSRFLAVVLSPAFTRADWPALEWQSKVYDDPSGRLGRILPILRHKYDPETGEAIEIPFALKILKYFDFTSEARFEPEFERLLRRIRGQRPLRGGGREAQLGDPALGTGQAAPDEQDEMLVSNLLSVRRYPSQIWSDLTAVERKSEVWNAYKGKKVTPFALYGGRLYSFVPPEQEDNPFRRFLTGRDSRVERPLDWLTDLDRARVLIGLFNAALREHCYQLDIWTTKDRERRYYCPILKNSRAFRWHRTARQRTLAKMQERPNGEPFGVHYSARMRFIHLGEELYLLIDPGWVFTSDGITPLSGKKVTRLSTAWGGRERNAAILRNVLMWSILISRGQPDLTVDLGMESIVLDTMPAQAAMRVGLPGDIVRLDTLIGGGGGGEFAPDIADAELDAIGALQIAGALGQDRQTGQTQASESVDEVEELELESDQ
jgi:hypothetical protein